ncbi:MAG: hypothetical protein LJE67_07040 [Salaquimonas sp.]|nr:hypothetical protein [Salaquimonas sp.]
MRILVLTAAAITLAACNSTSLTNGLGTASTQRPPAPVPTGSVGSETALAPQQNQTPPQAATTLQGGGQQVAALPRVPPVAFLPVTGAPQSAVTRLAGAMRSAAKAYAVPVVVSVQRGARYQLKGYFSALNDGSGSVLVYVWDVLDANGARVHRISGQERGGSASGDPWAGISNDMIESVARTTMDSLRSWVTTKAG